MDLLFWIPLIQQPLEFTRKAETVHKGTPIFAETESFDETEELS